MNFIGIDIGTTSICGVIFDPENKKTASVIKENNSVIKADNDWEIIQDPQKIISIIEEILEEFFQKFLNIKGIGIAGQMHGMLYVDQNGLAVSPLYTWQDGRGNLVYQNDLSYTNYLASTTGYSVASGFGLVTHFYNLKNNMVPERSSKLCTIMDYIVMKLSGRKIPLTDYSNAASLGFFDLRNLKFDIEAIKKISISPEILPEVGASAQIAGSYQKGVTVYSAIGDNQASFLGSVSDIEKSILVNIGTSGQISVYSGSYLKIETLDTRPFPGGGYIIVGASLCGGKSLTILKSFFEKAVNLFTRKSCSMIDFFEIVNSIDYSILDLENFLQVETLFNGTRENPDKRGLIKNISAENFTSENLIAGFLLGISNELYDFFNLMPEKVKSRINILAGSGNAIRMNESLCKILEEKFEMKLLIPKHQEEAAFGASLCAVIGGKWMEGYPEAGKMIQY